MIEIKDLLTRFQHILLSKESKAESIRTIIGHVIGVDIQSNDIKIKGDTVYINIKPIYKNEIFMNQEKISKLLEEALGKKIPTNIR